MYHPDGTKEKGRGTSCHSVLVLRAVGLLVLIRELLVLVLVYNWILLEPAKQLGQLL